MLLPYPLTPAFPACCLAAMAAMTLGADPTFLYLPLLTQVPREGVFCELRPYPHSQKSAQPRSYTLRPGWGVNLLLRLKETVKISPPDEIIGGAGTCHGP